MSTFDDVSKVGDLTKAVDGINDLYGAFTMYSANTIEGKKVIKQKSHLVVRNTLSCYSKKSYRLSLIGSDYKDI